jgi:hypothetical protein
VQKIYQHRQRLASHFPSFLPFDGSLLGEDVGRRNALWTGVVSLGG